jgi:hypothetical protein
VTAGDPPRLRSASSTETPPFLQAALEESLQEGPEPAQLDALAMKLSATIRATAAVAPPPPPSLRRTLAWAVVAFLVAAILGGAVTWALWPSRNASPPPAGGVEAP